MQKVIKLNELWGHNVLDFNLQIDQADVSIHFDLEDALFNLMCLKYTSQSWENLDENPIDGKFRGVLL